MASVLPLKHPESRKNGAPRRLRTLYWQGLSTKTTRDRLIKMSSQRTCQIFKLKIGTSPNTKAQIERSMSRCPSLKKTILIRMKAEASSLLMLPTLTLTLKLIQHFRNALRFMEILILLEVRMTLNRKISFLTSQPML